MKRWARQPAGFGLEVEAQRANQRISDAHVLEYATGQGRAILTLNRVDFHARHKAAEVPNAGIVTCTENANFRALADRIHAALEHAVPLTGKLVRVMRGD